MADEEVRTKISTVGMADFLGDLRSADKAVTDFANKVSSAGEAAAKNFANMGASANSATNSFSAFAKVGGQVAQAGDSVSKSVLVAGSSFTKSASEASSFGSKVGEAGSKLLEFGGKAAEAVVNGLEHVGKAALEAGMKLGELGGHAALSALEGIGHMAEETGAKLLEFGKVGVEKLAEVGKESISLAGDYQQSMNRVKFLTQASDETMQEFNKAAIEIGKTTVFSSKVAAEGFAQLAQMGYSAGDSMKLTKTAANAAMVANVDLGTSIKSMTTVMGAFGVGANEADHYLDMMVKSTQMGKLNFADFTNEMSRVGPTANLAHQSFANVNAAMLAFTASGMSVNQSANLLSATLVGLAKPNKGAADMIKTLGLNIYDAKGQMQPYSTIIGQLTTQTSKMTDEQRNYALATIFGNAKIKEVTQAMYAKKEVEIDGQKVTLQGAQLLKYYEDQINNSAGATERAGDILKQGYNYQLKQLKGSIEEAKISIGNALLPSMTATVAGIGKVVNKFIDWETETHTMKNAMLTFQGALEGSWTNAPGIGKVNKAFGEMGLAVHGALEIAKTDIKAFQLGMSGEWIPAHVHTIPAFFALLGHDIVSGLRAAGEIIHAFRLGLSGEWVPASIHTIPAEFAHIGNVISGFVKTAARDIAAFQLGLQGIGVGNSGGMAFFNKLGEAVSQIGPKVGPVISKFVELYQIFSPLSTAFAVFQGFLTGGIGGAFDALETKVTGMGNALGIDLTGAIRTVNEFVLNVFLPALGQVGNFVTGTVLPALGQFGSFISTNVLPALGQLGEFIFSTVIPAVQQFGQWLSANIGPILGSIGQTMQTTVIPAMQQFGGFIMTQVVPAVQSLATWIGNNVVPVIERFAGFIASTVIPIIGQLAAFVMNEVIPVVFQFAQGIAAFLQPILERVSAFITSTVIPALTQIGEFIQSTVIPALTQIYEYISANVMPIFIAVAGFLGGALADAFTLIADVVTVQWNIISTVVSTVWGVLSGIFNEIASFLQDPLGTTFTLLSAIVSAAWDAISGYVSAAWSVLSGIFNEIISSVTGTLGPVWDTLSGMVSTAWDAISGFISAAWGTISGIFGEVVSFVGGTLTSIWDTLSGAISGVWNTITSAIGTAVGNILTALGEIVTGIGSVVGQAAAQAVQIGTGIISGIVSGLAGAAGQVISFLAGMAQQALGSVLSIFGIHSPSTVFAEKVGKPVAEGMAKGISDNKDKPKKAASDTALDILNEAEKVISNISKSVDSGISAISKLKNYTAANMSAISQFASDLSGIISVFEGAASKFKQEGLEAATKFTDAAYKITGGIENAIKGMVALKDYSAMNQTTMNAFVSDLSNMVILFVGAAKNFNEKGLAAATAFADAANKITGIIGNAVKAFNELNSYSAIDQNRVNVFVGDLLNLTLLFEGASQNFEQSGLAAATLFAETAGKIAGIINNAVKAFADLNTYIMVDQNRVNAFVGDLLNLTLLFAGAAQNFETKGLAGATSFAEAAGKITGIIGNSVKGFEALAEYGAVDQNRVNIFTGDLLNLVLLFEGTAKNFQQKGLDAAVKFAEAAGKITGMIGGAVKGFSELSSYKAVGMGFVDTFMTDLDSIIQKFVETASKFEAKGLAAAVLFAESAGKVTSVIGNGVKGFAELSSYKSVASSFMSAFMADLSTLVQDFIVSSAGFKEDGLKAATLFADAAGKIVGIVANGAKAFTELAQYQKVPPAAIQAFVEDISLAVSLAAEATAKMNGDMLVQVGQFGDATGKLFNGFKAAMDVFASLRTFKSTPSTVIREFIDEIIFTVGLATELTKRADKDLIEQTVKFSEAIGKIFSGLKSALELFKTLETFKGIPPEQIKLLLDAISKAVVLMAQAHDRSLQFKERALDFENDLKAGFLSIREAASIALETARKAAQTVAEVDAIPNPPDKKPPEGGSKGGGSGKPPGAALGGIIGSAGAVMVGEKGPEIVFLPKGATVLNHQISMELLGGLATVQPPPSQSQIYNSVANSYSNRTYAPQYNLHLNSEQSTGNIITDFNILKALA